MMWKQHPHRGANHKKTKRLEGDDDDSSLLESQSRDGTLPESAQRGGWKLPAEKQLDGRWPSLRKMARDWSECKCGI